MKPRGRIFNGDNVSIGEFVGRRIDELVAYRCGSEDADSVDVVGFLLKDAPHWHRFFLDAGIGFWDELSVADVFVDFEDCLRLDLSDTWDLSGARCDGAACTGGDQSPSQFEWGFESGVVRLRYHDVLDLDSPSVLTFARKANTE